VSETRQYEVGMSVESLASAWARTEAAPDGAVVVVDSEISGRLRGGVPWRVAGDDALMMAMVIRPALNPLHEALLWLVASLATADALADVSGEAHTMIWPDTVLRHGVESAHSSINVMVQLGPGRIEHAVLAVRTRLDGLEATKEELLRSLEEHLLAATRLVETDSLALLEMFNDRSSIMSQRARVSLLPRGEARGQIIAVDPEGFLVLESSTGMLERIAPASLRSLELVD
jgi:biotin-(acetyl-CoA carboxylase) ligase